MGPDIIVDGVHASEQGGRRFELIQTPEGETADGHTVWLPVDHGGGREPAFAFRQGFVLGGAKSSAVKLI